MTPKSLVLTGLSGSGKSTVGRLVASQLGWPFVDLDERIVLRANMSAEMIFEKLGEAYFRRLEAELLADALSGDPVVLATGGGALVNDSSRQLALSKGHVVWLQVAPETAAKRCSESEVRPLLAGDPVGKLRALLTRREGAYADAHHAVKTDGRSRQAVADELVSLLREAA